MPDLLPLSPLPPPEPGPEVMVWFAGPYGQGDCAFAIDADDIRAHDPPATVLAWLDAWERWHIEDATRRAALPIDHDPTRPAWRMFGGPWIYWGVYLADGEIAVDVATRAERMMTPDAFRAWAMMYYEMVSIGERMAAELLRRAQDVPGPAAPVTQR